MPALRNLFAASPESVDELVVMGVGGLFWYCALGFYAVLWTHQSFDPLTYASGIATVLGALGGAKRWRDGAGNSVPPSAGSSASDTTAAGGG